MKKRIKKFNRYQIIITKKEKKAILDYLAGDLVSRELGKKLGCSHQQSINLVSQIFRQWYQKGIIKLKNSQSPLKMRT